jgi:hypothetical protein
LALVLPFLEFGLDLTPRALLGVSVLASPLALVAVAQFRSQHSWRGGFALAVTSMLIFGAWQFAAVLMWYFQPGIAGAIVLGALLCIPAAVGTFAVRSFERWRNYGAA